MLNALLALATLGVAGVILFKVGIPLFRSPRPEDRLDVEQYPHLLLKAPRTTVELEAPAQALLSKATIPTNTQKETVLPTQEVLNQTGTAFDLKGLEKNSPHAYLIALEGIIRHLYRAVNANQGRLSRTQVVDKKHILGATEWMYLMSSANPGKQQSGLFRRIPLVEDITSGQETYTVLVPEGSDQAFRMLCQWYLRTYWSKPDVRETVKSLSPTSYNTIVDEQGKGTDAMVGGIAPLPDEDEQTDMEEE